MPGIVGLITKMPPERAELQLARMVESVRHEAFYTSGTFADESLGIYAGWVARPDSFCDRMPVRNECGDVVLAISGEEYPEPGTAQRLRDRGHDVCLDGPCYLAHWYEDDPNFLRGLNGRFHGLLVDRRVGTATLFNDRYGMHRLYYHEAKDAFYFAVEAKAILAARPELRRINPQSLGEFIACSCTLENRSLFQDVYSLPAGSAWQFRNGALENKTSYFRAKEWEEQETLDFDSYYRELRDVFARNLPRYFVGKEKTGMSLTGGLDTRIIMAWRKPEPGTLPCYTFGGTYRDCEDVRIARRVAGVCGQPYSVIEVGQEFLAKFPRYAERSIYITEGGVDLSRTSDLYVNEKARTVAPARIAGTYGSEILRQLAMFKAITPRPGLFSGEALAEAARAQQTYEAIRGHNPVTFAAFEQSPWYHYGVLALEQTNLTVRSPYLDSDFVRTVYKAPKLEAQTGDIRLRLIADGSAALAAIPTDRGLGGNGGALVEALRHAYLEFTFKAEYAYDYGMPQWLAKIDHAFAPLHFERLFLGRHKLLHYRVWFRNQLAGYVRDVLLDSRAVSRPYLERGAVERVVNGHLKGEENRTLEIHKMLSLELLHRLFVDA